MSCAAYEAHSLHYNDDGVWTLHAGDVQDIRATPSKWTVWANVGKRKAVCRACGGVMLKGKKRLSFVMTFSVIFTTQGHLHKHDCSNSAAFKPAPPMHHISTLPTGKVTND